MTVGVNPGEAVLYVEYDIDAVFDWLWEGEFDALIEFVFEELLDANGVFDTLYVVDEDPHGDTDTLGLKVADEHDEPIWDPVRPGVWEEFDDGDKVPSEEGVGVKPGDGVNSVVLDWILELDCRGVIEFDTEADELTEPKGLAEDKGLAEASGLAETKGLAEDKGLAETKGLAEDKEDALSEMLWAPVWEASGVWENVPDEEAELESISDTDALCVVDDELEPEYDAKGVMEFETDPDGDWE